MSEDHYYAWVRVGEGDPEPAAISGKKPNRTATTIGCPDTFNVDDPTSGCSIVLAVQHNFADNVPGGTDRYKNLHGRARELKIKCPLADDFEPWHEVDAIGAKQRERDYMREIKYKPHSYAGFGRRPSPPSSQDRS